MTVETTTSKAGPYAGAGTVGPFPVPFRFLDASHLQVTRTDASGVNTVLELGTDYSVQGVGQNTGAVTLLAPLAVGFKLTVLRNVPATQEADYVQNDAFPAESHERALDKLTMLSQQQDEMVGRALVVPPTDSPVSLVLPAAAARARRYLSFDELGRPVSTTFDIDAVQGASASAVAAAAGAQASEVNAAASAADAQDSADFAREQSDFVAQQVAATTPTVVRFSGDGAAATFGLPSVPGAEENTLVYISGVYQQKNTYQVLPGTSSLVFSEAPPVGTENIEVVIAPSVMLSIADAQDVSFVGPDGFKRSVGNYLKNGLSRAVLSFPSLAAAEFSAPGLPDGQMVDDLTGQKHYLVQNGTLIFQGNFLRKDLADPQNGATLVSDTVDNAVLNVSQINFLTSKSTPKPLQWFKTVGGLSGDSPALQAAVDSEFKHIILPRGNTDLGEPVVCLTNSDVNLIGQGQGATKLITHFAAGDILCFGDGSTNPNNVRVSHLSIGAAVQKTSGAALRVRNGHNIRFEYFRLDNGLHRGVQLDGGPQQFLYYVNDFEINSGVQNIIVGETDGLVQDFWLYRGVAFGATSDGLLLLNVSGFYLDAIDLLGCKKAMSTYPGMNQRVVGGLCSKVLCDTSQENGLSLITNGGIIADVTFDNFWASSNGSANVNNDQNNGVVIEDGSGAIDGIQFNGGRITGNKGAGVAHKGGVNIHYNNLQVFSNSQQGASQRSGYEIKGGSEHWSIEGGSSGPGGVFGSINKQAYGVDLQAGTTNNYVIAGVDLTGNLSGPMRNLATGSERYVADNPGYKNKLRGALLVAAGTSSTTIPHGLSVQPAQTDFLIQPTVDVAAGGVVRWWVSSVTATTFTLSVNAAATNNLFFAWDVKTAGA